MSTIHTGGPTAAELGNLVMSAAKALKAYTLDQFIMGKLYATWHAGRIGLFAAALRHQGRLSIRRFEALGSGAGFSPLDCRNSVIPALQQRGLLIPYAVDGKLQAVESAVLTFAGLQEAAAAIYEAHEPTPADRGTLRLLHEAQRIPLPKSAALELLSQELGEETAREAIALALNYSIVAAKIGFGLSEPLLYSEKVWHGSVTPKLAKALAGLNPTARAVLNEMVDKVRTYQGVPATIIRRWAATHNAENLVDLAIGTGLLTGTELRMGGDDTRTFLTSPHFYGDVGDEFGGDTADRVKVFLDSIRNGQHYGRSATGRILDPAVLLRKLINTGSIGPCTAIGTDYKLSEQSGIVRVKPSVIKSGQFDMHVVQGDVIKKVHSIVTTGFIETNGEMGEGDVIEGGRFASTEELRATLGKVATATAEAEREIMTRLRESS
jgi:hypothetical protein